MNGPNAVSDPEHVGEQSIGHCHRSCSGLQVRNVPRADEYALQYTFSCLPGYQIQRNHGETSAPWVPRNDPAALFTVMVTDACFGLFVSGVQDSCLDAWEITSQSGKVTLAN